MTRHRLPVACCLLSLVCAVAIPARAQKDDLSYALAQLAGNGPASFAKILLSATPEKARDLTKDLDAARDHAGAFLDHETIDETRISGRLTRLVIALHYEKYPVFVRVDRYQSETAILYLQPAVSRNVEDLLPALTTRAITQ